MATLVGQEHMPNVSHYLKEHLPDSFIVHQLVQRIINGQDPGFQVWSSTAMGSFSYNVIVISANPKRCQNPFYRRMVHLFCTDPTAIVQTLSSPGVINFDEKSILFYGVSVRDMTFISTMEIWKQYDTEMSRFCRQYLSHDHQTIPTYQCPEGLQVSEITSAVLKTVANEHWAKDMEGIDEAHKEWMKWKLANICIYNEENRPIAWERKSLWGDQGSLFVIESYRGKGIGKYVASRLAKQLIEKEGFALAYIEDCNFVSQRFHEAIGFKENETKIQYNWRLYTLK